VIDPSSQAELQSFVRSRTRPLPVPLVPELVTYQADELTSLWHATCAELAPWDAAPFWAFPWAGGQAVARYILDWPEIVRGKSVLDFASGSGLVGIAAARAGAARVEACDLDPFARAAVALNAQLNDVSIAWREGDLLGGELSGIDVVLAGDVFYERALSEACLSWLAALRARGVLTLVGDPGRLYTPREGLVDWASYDVPTSPEIEQAAVLRTSVQEVLPRAAAKVG
jgi:predicted nicotinamide N-methyase